MNPAEWATGLAIAVVAVVLVVSGPLGGEFLQPSGPPTALGDGNATVDGVDVATDDLVVAPGRFGTGVTYVRIPDATVDLASVSGRPRLFYRVEVPELDVGATTKTIVTEAGQHRLHVRDQGLDSANVTERRYRATVTVRLQSFSTDRTVYERNVTAEVRP